MANIFLSTGDTNYKIANNNATVSGTAGADTIIIEAGVTGTVVSNTVEQADLSGNVADFRFKQGFGGNITVEDANGNVIATMNVNSQKLAFADGAVDVTFDSTTGLVSVGGTEITTTAAAVVPATIDTTIVSQAGGTTTPADGQTFALTTGNDISGSITGSAGTTSTEGDDTITATGDTYTSGDVINGGEGTDTLNLALTANGANTPTVVGVESININTSSFSDLSYDAAGVVGVGTTFTLNNGQVSGATGGTLSNVASGATVNAGTGVTGGIAVDSADGILTVDAGSATIASITDATALTLSGTSLTQVNLDGANNTTDSASVSAAGAVALNTNTTHQVGNLTLSGNGAAVTYTLDAGDAPEVVTLTGDQSVTLIAAAADVSTETITDTTTAGTTTLRINDDTTADFSNVAVDVIDVNDGTTGSVTYTVKNEQAVLLSADSTGTGTAAIDSTELASGNETLNLNITTSQSTSDLTVSDFEVVNLDTTNAAVTTASPVTLFNLVGSSATGAVINVAGDENLILTDATATKLDATALTGNLTVTIAADLNDITGGAGTDTINAIDTDFSVAGGTGNDTLAFAATTDLSNNTVTFSGVETVQLDASTPGNADTVTFNSSVISGQSFIVKGTGTGVAADVLVAKANDTTVNLSGLTVDTTTASVTIDLADVAAVATNITGSNGADTLTNAGAGNITVDGGAGNDTLTTDSGTDVVTGGAGDDTIATGAGNDTITAGEGVDGITGGAGNDTINLTETVAAVDTVTFSAAANNGADTISGFAVANDLINVKALGGTVVGEAAIAADAATTDLTTANVAVFADGANGTGSEAITDYTDMADVVSFLAAGLTEAATETYVAVINDVANNKAYVYDIDVDGVTTVAGTIEVGDVTLVGTINTDGALTVANTDFA
jgi:hypothetical protein